MTNNITKCAVKVSTQITIKTFFLVKVRAQVIQLFNIYKILFFFYFVSVTSHRGGTRKSQ